MTFFNLQFSSVHLYTRLFISLSLSLTFLESLEMIIFVPIVLKSVLSLSLSQPGGMPDVCKDALMIQRCVCARLRTES